jgi:hypothetical protein
VFDGMGYDWGSIWLSRFDKHELFGSMAGMAIGGLLG